MIAYGVLGIFWPPMHQREVLAAGGGTLTDILHIAFTGTVLFIMVAIGYASAALGKRFRIYSIVTLVVMVISGVRVGMEAPGMHTGQPTPLIGVWERVSIAAFMLWIVVFALALLPEPELQPKGATGHRRLVPADL
jgi:hypothetical protein